MKTKYMLILLIFNLFECKAARVNESTLSDDEIQLFKAIAVNDIQTIQWLISYGVNVNIVTPEKISIKFSSNAFLQLDKGETPLNQAVKWPKFNAVKALVDAGADINALAGERQDTPLHSLARVICSSYANDWPQIMYYLLERGANPRTLNANGESVFGVAYKNRLIDNKALEILSEHEEIKENYQKKIMSLVKEELQTHDLPEEITALTGSYICQGDWEKNIREQAKSSIKYFPFI